MRFLVLAVCLFGLTAWAEAPSDDAWILNAAESRIVFTSVKAEDIGETHYFKDFKGHIQPTGDFHLEIALESVETGIDIRNERMRKFLFETNLYPRATVAAKVDMADFETMTVGERRTAPVMLELDIHGIDDKFRHEIFVTRIAENRVLIETLKPMILHADDFDLGAGVIKLRELVGLPSITPVFPITVSLVFEH